MNVFKFLRSALIGLCIIATCCYAEAAQVNSLYSATVPVESQDSNLRNDALAQALEQVLIKVSGNESALEISGARAMLASAELYVVSFSYKDNPAYQEAIAEREQQDQPEEGEFSESRETSDDSELAQTITDSAVSDAEDVLPAAYLLNVSFAQSTVEQTLSKYGVPIWGRIRPSMLFWLVDEVKGERRLLGSSDTEYVETLLDQASIRGLPVFLPVVDLSDLSTVDLNALWGLYPESVEGAAERYQADLNVLVRKSSYEQVALEGQQLALDWTFQLKGFDYSGTATGAADDQLWSTLLADVSMILAERYAVQQTTDQEPGNLTIRVSQINSFFDYASLQKYLQSLPNVGTSELLWVQGDQVAYRLTLKGQRAQFFEYLELGGRLQWVASQESDQILSLSELESEQDTDTAPSYSKAPVESFLWIDSALPKVQ